MDAESFNAYAHQESIDPSRNRLRLYSLAWQPFLFAAGAAVRRQEGLKIEKCSRSPSLERHAGAIGVGVENTRGDLVW